jgi:hypothetical protein
MSDPIKPKTLQRYDQDYGGRMELAVDGEYVEYKDVINLLKTVFRNNCGYWAPSALRYLAENERPIGGESSFNIMHLYQLADEIEGAYATIKRVANE